MPHIFHNFSAGAVPVGCNSTSGKVLFKVSGCKVNTLVEGRKPNSGHVVLSLSDAVLMSQSRHVRICSVVYFPRRSKRIDDALATVRHRRLRTGDRRLITGSSCRSARRGEGSARKTSVATNSRLSSQPDRSECRQIAAIDVAHVPATTTAAAAAAVTSRVTGDKLVVSPAYRAILLNCKRLNRLKMGGFRF